MYNILLSTLASLAVGVGVVLSGFPWYSAIFPMLLVWPLVAFLIGRRISKQVEAAMAPLPGLLTSGKVDQARKVLAQTVERFGRWQPLLTGQIRGQIGLMDYMQLRFDDALPNLEQGGWRDWTAPTAAACIHVRRGDAAAAEAAFEKAAKAAPKEPTVYLVWALTLARKGDGAKALSVLSRGLDKVPENPGLKDMKVKVANKKRVELSRLPEGVQRFFPEELAQQLTMRGRRGPHPLEGQVPTRVQQGPPAPRMRGKMARRR